ncbi:MAG: DegV family protein [Anaerolineae bacterium]|nr:DegV family protein [Caldilineales bacterium]MDW8268160.1 DegV family protein [Anaerolineae bacterium]
MKPFRIVTDSSAHLTRDEIKRFQIEVVPMRIRLGRRVYTEGVDITTESYLRRLSTIKTLPTSQPPPLQDFIDVYYRLGKETDQILSIHLSSKLSPVCELARTAAAALRAHAQITVIDSETISRGLGMIVRCAAEAAAGGASLTETARLVRGLIGATFFSFFVDDLSYLERDGRIRPSQALLGSLFAIKPLLEIREGHLVVMEKVRTQLDMVEKLFTFISEFAYLKEVALLQNNNTPVATALLERLETAYPDLPIFTDTYGPTLATFIGPSALGVIVREDVRLFV